jgi:hypothetical protein
MSTPHQVGANRANARKSTGPRTRAGKTRTSRNARRHGLSVAIDHDPALSAEVDELVRHLVDGAMGADIIAQAHAFAEAAIDLARVQRARLELTRRVLLATGTCVDDRAVGAAFDAAAVGEPAAVKPAIGKTAAGKAAVAAATRQLAKLDRYERRARARRRLAARAFTDRFIDVVVQRQGASRPGSANE